MPRDIFFPLWLSKTDRFHPTGDVAITDATCTGSLISAGWWDESNELKSIKVSLISGGTSSVLLHRQVTGAPWFHNTTNAEPITVTTALADDDVIEIEVIDSSDNRQIYKKRVDQLKEECDPPVLIDDIETTMP
jgi:hypothetical protein